MTDAGIPQHHQYDFSKGLPGTVEQQILATLERIESILREIMAATPGTTPAPQQQATVATERKS